MQVLPDAPDLTAPGLSSFDVPAGRVAQLLRELKPHKACGPDGLSARILMECADEIAVPLEIICRLSVRSGVFPTQWKRANVIPVYKKGSKKLPGNYRPVSLLPICSKILEKVVSESLLLACLPALPSSQHGFVPKRSCVTNLACFTQHCWTSFTMGLQTDAIYTDFTSAFTSVNHKLLLHKLRYSFKLIGPAFRWVESYLSQRSQRVILEGKHSDSVPVLSGVPEGSILGPILFACYVADVPANVYSGCLAYADDIKIFHRVKTPSDANLLQADIDYLVEWSKIWRLKLNPAKCRVITFTLRRTPIVASYVLDGHQLERCDYIRDLGVLLDSKLNFALHVDATMARANQRLGLLMRGMQMAPRPRQAQFDHQAVLCAYKAHVRSIIEYASVIWSGAAKSHLVRFERLQHRFLMWLGARTRSQCPQMDYDSLMSHFKLQSIRSRFTQTDITFMRSVFSCRLDCAELVSMFPLSVPNRRSRHTDPFHVPQVHCTGRVDAAKHGFLGRLPRTVNQFLKDVPEADFFCPSSFFRSQMVTF